jgi:hypothetical protein
MCFPIQKIKWSMRVGVVAVLERNGTHFDPINVWVISQQFNTKTNSKLRTC